MFNAGTPKKKMRKYIKMVLATGSVFCCSLCFCVPGACAFRYLPLICAEQNAVVFTYFSPSSIRKHVAYPIFSRIVPPA